MMLGAFGVCASGVGLMCVIWFFYMGFMIKRVIKELQETNRLLRSSGAQAPGAVAGKAA
jgi:hypothetical protein